MQNARKQKNRVFVYINYVNKVCPACRRSKQKKDHVVFLIPRRDDVCFAFCDKWDNRLFLVYERDGELHHKKLAGADGYRVIPMEESIVLKGNIVEIYCGVANFIGSSGGAQLIYDLGKPGQAQPVSTGKSRRVCI